MNYEKTTNGIEYTEELAGSNGMAFMLFPTPEHTTEMIKTAIRDMFDIRDVVSLKVANEQDWDERYRSEIFAHPLIRPYRWFEIKAGDYDTLRRERLNGTTVEDYVKQYVIPFADETRKKNWAKYGDKMFDL
jgi:hypothetical protein